MQDVLQATAQFVDSTYRVENHKNYRLSIQFRLDGFSFAIIEPLSKQLLLIQEFKIISNPKEALKDKWLALYEHFLEYLAQNTIHPDGFEHCTVVVDHKDYTLFPDALFDEAHQKDLLSFSQSIAYSFVTINNKIPDSKYRIISAIYKPLYLTIDDFNDDIDITHSSMIIQNEIQKHHKNKRLGNYLYVSVSMHDMQIVAIKDNQVLLNNSYSFSSKEDFVYFILLSYDQLNLNPEKDAVYFLGDIGRTSPIYNICWQYIRHIRFVDQVPELSLGTAFDQMPIHQYFTLIQASLCEL